MTAVDLKTEEFRVYHYADGSTFRVERPIELFVLDDAQGSSHRVLAEDGCTYRPERNWTGISWKPRDGAPAFVA